jgi:hypothetical protein
MSRIVIVTLVILIGDGLQTLGDMQQYEISFDAEDNTDIRILFSFI